MTTTKGNVGKGLSDLVQQSVSGGSNQSYDDPLAPDSWDGSGDILDPNKSSDSSNIDPTLLDRVKGISPDTGATIDPCLVYARLGKEAFEQGLPLPDQKDSEFTSSQYNCFYDGYVKAQMESGQANDNALLIGGLALGGLVILGLVASKKGWI